MVGYRPWTHAILVNGELSQGTALIKRMRRKRSSCFNSDGLDAITEGPPSLKSLCMLIYILVSSRSPSCFEASFGMISVPLMQRNI